VCDLETSRMGAPYIYDISRLRVKWTRPFRRKTKSGFCACITLFQTQSTIRNTKIYGVSYVKLLRVRSIGNWNYQYA